MRVFRECSALPVPRSECDQVSAGSTEIHSWELQESANHRTKLQLCGKFGGRASRSPCHSAIQMKDAFKDFPPSFVNRRFSARDRELICARPGCHIPPNLARNRLWCGDRCPDFTLYRNKIVCPMLKFSIDHPSTPRPDSSAVRA